MHLSPVLFKMAPINRILVVTIMILKSLKFISKIQLHKFKMSHILRHITNKKLWKTKVNSMFSRCFNSRILISPNPHKIPIPFLATVKMDQVEGRGPVIMIMEMVTKVCLLRNKICRCKVMLHTLWLTPNKQNGDVSNSNKHSSINKNPQQTSINLRTTSSVTPKRRWIKCQVIMRREFPVKIIAH